MSTQKRQLEILEFLRDHNLTTRSEINHGLQWQNSKLTNLLIQDLYNQKLIFHDSSHDISLARFSISCKGFKTLQDFGG